MIGQCNQEVVSVAVGKQGRGYDRIQVVQVEGGGGAILLVEEKLRTLERKHNFLLRHPCFSNIHDLSVDGCRSLIFVFDKLNYWEGRLSILFKDDYRNTLGYRPRTILPVWEFNTLTTRIACSKC